DGGVGGLPYHGFGVEGDAHPGGRDHVEVVGAVADGDGLADRDARLGGEPLQGPGLARTVDDLADEPSGEDAVDHLQGVGGGVVDAQFLDQVIGDLREATADDRETVVQ